MTSDRRARIRHLAGLLAVHACWPNPDGPDNTATRLDLTWSGPMAVLATGDHVRAARQALEEA